MDCTLPGFPVHHQLPEPTQTHVHWVGDSIQPSHPLSSPSPLTFNLSQHQGLFKWVSSSHQVSKVLEFQFQHQSFQWIFRTDLLQNGLVGSPCSQGTLESLLQHCSSKASILQCFIFIVQLSHPYMTTGETTALTRRTFVGKVVSVLFNMLSGLVIGCLPRSKPSSSSFVLLVQVLKWRIMPQSWRPPAACQPLPRCLCPRFHSRGWWVQDPPLTLSESTCMC